MWSFFYKQKFQYAYMNKVTPAVALTLAGVPGPGAITVSTSDP